MEPQIIEITVDAQNRGSTVFSGNFNCSGYGNYSFCCLLQMYVHKYISHTVHG